MPSEAGIAFVAHSIIKMEAVEPLKVFGYFLFAIYALTSLWLLLNGLIQLHLLWHYKKRKPRQADTLHSSDQPFVSIQVPVYNEKYVIQRLLEALASLDYPKDRFEVQVLDDSTDDTSAIIDKTVSNLAKQGIDITIIRRGNRQGYKAGALQAGLTQCKGELVAIFDADFVPSPDFLQKLLPPFANPEVGLVQARWAHLNREENILTQIQTYLLDTHFSIEQSGRSEAGYFINFCGTAGIWRKACIEDAGGWDGSVLSEDLDLSYRAQLKGWKLVYDERIQVPAELPSVIEAFKIQQFRWTKGMAQISRKLLKQVWQTPLPAGKKLHGIFHLLGSFVFVCLFINALLTVPLLLFRSLYPEFITLTQYSLVSSLNLVALTLFYYHGTQTLTPQKGWRFFKHFPLFLVMYMALSVQNAIAVWQGLRGTPSAFVRTPKGATSGRSSYLQGGFNWINGLELAVLFYFTGGTLLSFYLGDYFMLLFFGMIGSGLVLTLYQSLAPLRRKA